MVEAFGCGLPSSQLATMRARRPRPVWINLEYLSAEDWIADFHLRPSPHPRYSLVKTFFFPGLVPGTGGVLKERDLDAQRAAFEASPAMREQWWRVVFFVVAIIAAVFGFTGIAVGAAEIAKILFFIFLILFVVSLVAGLLRRGP